MPLPVEDQPWPPPQVKTAYASHAIDDAWFTGDTNSLAMLYSNTANQGGSSLWGGIKRWFWGSPTPGTAGQAPVKLHIPIAGEVARMSAGLLFGQMFAATFETDDDDTDHDRKPGDPVVEPPADPRNRRLAELLGDDAHGRFLEVAEFMSAHGGGYLKVSWDLQVQPDGPFLTVAAADTAIPEFTFGRLSAVTFWTKLTNRAGQSYRLLERQEPGTVEFALYESPVDGQLGRRTPLTDHPDVAGLATVVNADSQIETGSTLLTAQYLPNVKPNRRWRKDPLARNLGRSDFDGVYDLFDAADETFTSYMRDIRLAKARLTVPAGAVTIGTPGSGATFNTDQELFLEIEGSTGSLNMNAKSGAAQSSGLELFQPDIRDAAHRDTLGYLRESIYTACGYSPQSFGESGDIAITATEVTAREKLTILSRSAKILAATPPLVMILAALLDVDEHVFAGPGRGGDLPTIEWPDAASDAPKIVAETLQALNLSESTSIKTRVEMLHPDWTAPQVDAEVDAIKADVQSSPLGTEKDLWSALGGTTAPTPGVSTPGETVATDGVPAT